MTLVESIFKTNAKEKAIIQPKYIILADNLTLDTVNKLESIDSLEAPERVVVMVYYDAPAGNFISAEIQKKLINFAHKHELKFLQGHGIGYHNLLNEGIEKGDIIVSCGYHNSIFGAEGAAGIHLEPEVLLETVKTGEVAIETPETIHIELTGKLNKGASVKDIAIKFLQAEESKYKGRAIEFVGESLKELSAKQKQDLCQLAGRSGAVCALTNNDYTGEADETIDLSKAEVMIALPGSIHTSDSIESLEGTKLCACFIGGCTGGSIEDLRTAAEILKGKKIPTNLRLTVAPQTNEVFSQAIAEGLLDIFIDCGAQILNAGCGTCRTTSKGVIGDGEIMLSSAPWNYEGCNGTKESKVYLASVETVAISALNGYIHN